MKQIFDKMIDEEIPIEQCQKGDRIYLSGGTRAAHGYGNIIICNIKQIGKGKVQIKYQTQFYWGNQEPKVHKADIYGKKIVRRTRKWKISDSRKTDQSPIDERMLQVAENNRPIMMTVRVPFGN